MSADLTVRNSEMQSISCWEDVTPFAGSVVAYKIDELYQGVTKGFTLEDESIKFGYVEERVSFWIDREKGYEMSRLLHAKESPGICALINSRLVSSISMRLATSDEIGFIGGAIRADQAAFENMIDKREVATILERHVSRLSKTPSG